MDEEWGVTSLERIQVPSKEITNLTQTASKEGGAGCGGVVGPALMGDGAGPGFSSDGGDHQDALRSSLLADAVRGKSNSGPE